MVRRITRARGHIWRISRAASRPFRAGIAKSRTATSGQRSRAMRTACWPSAASPTISNPSRCIRTLRPWRTMRWSSANRMRNGTSRLLGVALARVEYAHHTEGRVPARRQGRKSGEVPNWAREIPEGGASDPGWLGLDQAPPNRVTDEARRLVDLELLHDPGPVGLRGLHADPE